MLCPRCMREIARSDSKTSTNEWICPECKQSIPPLYEEKYGKFPPVPVTLVGLRGHGKTCYLAGLLIELERRMQSKSWDKFSYEVIDEESIQELRSKTNSLINGTLPISTAPNDLVPILLLLDGIPTSLKRCQLLLYDTAGESFSNPNAIEQMHFGSIGRIDNIIWLVDLEELEEHNTNLTDTISRYAQAMATIERKVKNQNLLLVLTKGDKLRERKNLPESIRKYLTKRTDQYRSADMANLSTDIRSMLRGTQETGNFVRVVERDFKKVSYTIVSSLGDEPIDDESGFEAEPRGVEYPLLWACELAAHQRDRRRFRKLMSSIGKVLPGAFVGGIQGAFLGGLLWVALFTITNLANMVIAMITNGHLAANLTLPLILNNVLTALRASLPLAKNGILIGLGLFGVSEVLRTFHPQKFLTPRKLYRRVLTWMVRSAVIGVLVFIAVQFIDSSAVVSQPIGNQIIMWIERGSMLGFVIGIVHAILIPLFYIKSADLPVPLRRFVLWFSLFSGAAITALVDTSLPWWLTWFGVTLFVSSLFAVHDMNISRQRK